MLFILLKQTKNNKCDNNRLTKQAIYGKIIDDNRKLTEKEGVIALRAWLRDLRESSGQSQQQIADKMGITRQYYQQIEAGDRQQKMDITLCSKLADLFEISIEEIVSREKEIRQQED